MLITVAVAILILIMMMGVTAPSTAIPRPDLQGHVRAYNADPAQFIAGRILPCIAVKKKLDNYYKVGADAMFELPNVDAAKDGSLNRTQFGLTTGSYKCSRKGLEGLVSDDDKNEYASAFDLESFEAMRVTNMLLRAHENLVLGKINTTNWPLSGTTGVTVGTAWTSASATPAADVAAAAVVIANKVGIPLRELSLCIGNARAYQYLPQVTDFKNKMFASVRPQPGDITEEILSQYFGVKEVIIAGAQYNSAITGQTPSLSSIWNAARAFLFYKAPGDIGARLDLGGIGATFCWDVYDEFGQGEAVALAETPLSIKTYRDETRNGDVVKVQHWTDAKITETSFGYLLGGV